MPWGRNSRQSGQSGGSSDTPMRLTICRATGNRHTDSVFIMVGNTKNQHEECRNCNTAKSQLWEVDSAAVAAAAAAASEADDE